MEDSKHKHVLLTGAFGLVGEETIRAMFQKGHQVTCLDLDTVEKRNIAEDLSREGKFDTIWFDGDHLEELRQKIQTCAPQVVIHIFAVAPPECYQNPQIAQLINVDFSQLILTEAKNNQNLERFIFVSSTMVHGPRNPNNEVNPIRPDTPLNPGDNFGKHKALMEEWVRDSGLPWSILRLPTVFGLRAQPSGDAFMKYMFALPPQRRQHGLDARDAGLAVANSVSADILFRVLTLGGKAPDWMRTAGEFFAAISSARGFKPIPERYYRNPDPIVDEAWYYEDWVNTAESQLFLDYQNHTFADYIKALSSLDKPVPNWLMNLMSPLVLRQLTKHSTYDREKDQLDVRSHWDVVCEIFHISQD